MFTSAFAQTPGALGGSADLIQFIVPMVAVLGIMYLMILRPQQKRAKDHKTMLSALRRGDRVVTGGGIIGTVAKVIGDDEVTVDIAEGTRVRVLRSTITSVLARTEPVSGKDDAADDGEPAGGAAKDKRKSVASK